MSYIKHRERIFHKRAKNVAKKRSDSNLRRISSCTDVRAWSLDENEQRQFFLDNITSKSSNTGKYIPADVIVDIIRKQNSSHLKKLNSLKRTSSEELIKKKSKENLVKKRSRVNISQDKGKSIKDDTEKAQTDLELSNLRCMIKDMESRLITMRSLEDENNKLKSLINVDGGANDKQNNLEIVPKQHFNQETNEEFKGNIALMKSECSKMRSDVEYLQTKNLKLSRRLRKTVSNERMLKNREFVVSMESVNNAILKSKVDGKEMKIRRLVSINEEQKSHIDILACQINEMAIAFSWKEEMLFGKLMEYKNMLKSGSDKLINYEMKLSLSQAVIKEMEVLRDHFRMVNTALRENTKNCKSHLRLVANKAIGMASRIDFLLREIEKRDAKIKELTKFPGRPSMAIRLSQLEKILQGDFLYERNKVGVVENFERLKKILKDLKKETWESYGFQDPCALNENFSQTTLDISDTAVQNCPTFCEIEVQSDYPDEYIIEFIHCKLLISVFSITFNKVKQRFKREQQANKNNQRLIKDQEVQLKSKCAEIEIIKNCNKILHDKIKILKNKIEESSRNVSSVTENSEFAISTRDSTHDLVEKTSATTLVEYDNYCDLLESFIERNEVYVEDLICDVINELTEQQFYHIDRYYELTKKCDYLEESLENETEVNFILIKEIDHLSNDVIKREGLIDILLDLWSNAVVEIDELKAMLEHQESIFRDHRINENIDRIDAEVMVNLECLEIIKSQSNEFISENESTLEWKVETAMSNCDRLKSLINSNYHKDSETYQRDAEVMVNLEDLYVIKTQSYESENESFVASLESKIETSISYCNRLKRIIKCKCSEEKKLKKKITQINMKVKKIKICIIKLRNKLDISVDSLEKLKETNLKLSECNSNLHSDHLKLTNDNEKLKGLLSNMTLKVEDETKKNTVINNNQTKLLNDYQKVHSELMKLKKLNSKIFTECSVNTDELMEEYDLSIRSKDQCIEQMKIRIEKLLDLLRDIEAEKKYKEDNAICIEIQTDDNYSKQHEKYQAIITEINEKHDDVLKALKKEHSNEKETKENYYRKNLSLLKDTYERDIKRIKKTNAESLRKMQTFHEDEMRTLKVANEEAMKHKTDPKDMTYVQEKHKLEMEQLRINYEKMIQEKNDLFMKEKEHLQEDMQKYKCDKEAQIMDIAKRMEITMKNMKKKCKLHVRKLQKENNFTVEEIKKDYMMKSMDDIQSIESSELYYRNDEVEGVYDVAERDEIINCKEDEGPLFYEARTETSGFEEDLYDSAMADERHYLLKRINQLEDQLAEKSRNSSENACDSEKRVWVEKVKCREVSQLLDKEMERSEKLRVRLNQERQRADQLALVNQALIKNIESLQQRKENKDMDSFIISDKKELSNNKYEELFDSYENKKYTF